MFIPALTAIGSAIGNEVLKKTGEALSGNNAANMSHNGLSASAGNNAANMGYGGLSASAGNNAANMGHGGLSASAGNNAANMGYGGLSASAGNNAANMGRGGFNFVSANQVANRYMSDQADKANEASQNLNDAYQKSINNIERVRSLFV